MGHGGVLPAIASIALLLLLLLQAPVAPAGTVTATSGGTKRYETIVQGGDRVFCVGRVFVEAGSDSVLLGGRPLRRDIDYSFDADQGCLFLNPSAFPDSLANPSHLVVLYRVLPAGLEAVYAHRDLSGGRTSIEAPPPDSSGVPITGEGTAGTRPGNPAGPATAAADTAGRSFPVRPVSAVPDGTAGLPELDLSGSKTFTFELGSNRDLSLRQTLDLRVNGNVSRDVKLRAILSDRNLPFQPEGNTAELEELDKILIEVEAPSARVGLGDQDVVVTGGSLARFSRRLQGLTADVTGETRSGRIVAASQRGEFRSFEFLGTEGKQGPYALADRAGGRGIVVVAGSERVWVDGVEMVRGLDNDYTVDYGRAELTFTPRRVITAESRIAVDYEFSAVGYRRSLYLASARNALLGGRLLFTLDTARENDDDNRPLSGELTEVERAQLAAAGDSLLSGGSGIRRVDPGTGRYRQAFDVPNSRTYYQYVGRGVGDYEIAFFRIGIGLGDYADSLAGADTVFVYRGPNTGAWAPAGGLTQPVSHGMGHGSARLDLPGVLLAEGEFAVSGRDLNTLSPLDDDDNEGSAGRLNLRSAPLPLRFGGRDFGAIEIGGHLRNLGSHFASLGRIDESFAYDREWNLAGRSGPIAENRREVTGLYRPRPGTIASGEWGGLSGGGRESDRRLYRFERAGTSFGSVAVLRVDSGVDSTNFSGRLERETARTGTRVWRVAPVAYYEREERLAPETGTGGRYTLGGGDLTFGPFGPLTFSLGAEARDTDSRGAPDSLWSKVSRALTRRGTFNLAAGAISASGLYQSRDASRPDAGRTRTDLATLDVSQRSPNAAFVTDLHARIATTGVEVRNRTLRPVGEGLGNYDEFGNLFPGGGYQLEDGPLGPERLTTDLDVSLRAEMNPSRTAGGERGGAIGWAARNLGWDGTVRLEEQSLLPLGRPAYLFRPSSYQKPGSTLRGRIQVRQALEIFPQSRTLVLRLKHDLDDVANYQYTDFREDRTEHLLGVAARSSPGRLWTVELEERFGRRSQGVTVAASPSQERKADVHESRGLVTFRPVTTTRLSVETTWRREAAGAEGKARSLDVNPRLSHVVGTRGRLDLAGRWITAVREGGYTGIGGFSSLFLQDRIELSLDGDYKLKSSITIGAGITGRRFEGSSTVIDGRTEVRAYF